MVDLPKYPRRVATVETPASSLTRSDLEGPFASLARGMTEAGDALMEVAKPLAEQAGVQSVRTGDDGMPVIDRGPLPIVGDAGVRFNRAAKMTYLAELQPRIENKLAELRVQHPNDPDGYQKAAGAYVETLTGGVSDPLLKVQVGKIAGDTAAQNYRTVLFSADRLNVQNAELSYKKQISDFDNKLSALARQAGTDTPEYQQGVADLKAIYGELSGDARFKYPAERIAFELDEMASRHKGEAVIGRAMSIYDRSTATSAAEARKFLRDAAWDTGLNLNPAQRSQIISRGMAALDGRTAENKSEVDANKKSVAETIEALKTSRPYDVRNFNDLVDRSARLGDVESYAKLVSYQALHNWRAAISPLPLPDQVEAVRSMRSSASFVERVIGVESGGDATAQAKTSTALGAGQFTQGTWLDLMKRNRPELVTGKSDVDVLALRTDRGLSREMVDAYARENRQRLAAAGVRTDDAALYLAHFLGPGDAIKVLQAQPGQALAGVVAQPSIDANRGIFERNPTAAQLVNWAERKMGVVPGAPAVLTSPLISNWASAVKAEAVNDVSRSLGSRAEQVVSTLETAIGKGRTPDAQEVRDIAALLHETGRNDLVERVDAALSGFEVAQAATKMPVAVRQAFRAQMQTLAGDKSDPKQRRVIDTAEDVVRSVEQGMRERPYATGARRGLHGPPAPLDFANSEMLAAAIDQRSAMDKLHRSHDGTPAQSAFEGREKDAFTAALAQGDAKVVAGTFAALNRLDDDQLVATLDDDGIKGSIRGAMRSTDPAKYSATMSALDRLYARGPQTFTRLMGDDAWHALKTWQATTRYYDQKQIAADRARVEDPQVRARRETNEKEGREVARKMSPDEVVGKFDTSWWITPGTIAREVTGSQPLPPVDPGTRDALMGDYETIFARRYAETLDKDVAHSQTAEMLKTKWARSEINGGRLMLRAPEAAYPMVDGSHRWMREQLEADLVGRLGPRQLASIAPDAGNAIVGTPSQPVTAWDYALVSDRRTEADVLAGKPASYVVMIRDARKTTPVWEVMKRDDGGDRRLYFDPAAAQAKARQDFAVERRRVLDRTPPIDTMLGTP